MTSNPWISFCTGKISRGREPTNLMKLQEKMESPVLQRILLIQDPDLSIIFLLLCPIPGKVMQILTFKHLQTFWNSLTVDKLMYLCIYAR